MEAKKDMVTRQDLRHDRHTVSLLTDHKTFKKVLSKTPRNPWGMDGKW